MPALVRFPIRKDLKITLEQDLALRDIAKKRRHPMITGPGAGAGVLIREAIDLLIASEAKARRKASVS